MRKKVNNFVRFMRKLDGKTVPEKRESKWDEESLRKTSIIELSSLRLAAQGRHLHLISAFAWRMSPQGHDYWHVREEGIEELSEEDLAFLRQLYEYHQQEDGYDLEFYLDDLVEDF